MAVNFNNETDQVNITVPAPISVSLTNPKSVSVSVTDKGRKGDTGATGPQGIQGVQGPAGNNGTNGTNGTNGQDGADGADGQDGADGTDGTFQLEDGDGTEVTISNGKEVKFVEGSGIDINWTDTSNGTDGDPYDLTFTVDHDAAANFVAEEHYRWDNDISSTATIHANNVPALSNTAITGTLSVSELITPAKGHLYTKTSSTHFEAQGDIVKIGTGSTTQGELCYYKSDGTWEAANANAVGTSGGCLLGIALGNDPDSDGMLLRGMFTLDHDPGTIADELYVSTTPGDIQNSAPTGNNDVVRIIGYCLDSTNGQIFFNPSSDFVVVTA